MEAARVNGLRARSKGAFTLGQKNQVLPRLWLPTVIFCEELRADDKAYVVVNMSHREDTCDSGLRALPRAIPFLYSGSNQTSHALHLARGVYNTLEKAFDLYFLCRLHLSTFRIAPHSPPRIS